jgi:proteic killer suppression protein
MIQSFADGATEDVYHGAASKRARRLPQDVWPLIKRKLSMLNASTQIEQMRRPPGNRLEALRGDRRGRWSIRVNDQWRITFRWDGGHAYEVRCEDYHS